MAVRISPDAHRRIRVAAIREHKSLGQVVSDLAREHLPAVKDLASVAQSARRDP
jgi:predicted HicB family RNase H-like nuclease